VLQRSPGMVTLVFTEQAEPSLSVVHVLDSVGHAVERGPAQAVEGYPLELQMKLPRLSQGVFTVSWRTVSRVDGHAAEGAFAFGIGVAPLGAPAAQVTTPAPSPLAVAGKWGLYAGLSGLLGAAWVWALVVRPSPERIGWYPWLVWALCATGIIAVGADQADTAGVTVSRLLTTPLGRALVWRAVPIGASGIAIAAGQVLSPRGRRIAIGAAGGAALLAMWTHVLAGHAGASTGPWRWAQVADQWLHFAGVGTWMGGLAALLIALRGEPGAEKAAAARRFSWVAGIALAVVAGTGVIRAIADLGTWRALVSTTFGIVILLKAAFLLLLAALGAVNRYRSIPASPWTLRGLHRIGGTELAVAGGVLVLTGILTGLAPPSLTQGGAGPSPSLSAAGADFATSVRVRLDVTPGVPGVNRFVARIADYDTGRPVVADRMTLRFELPARPDIGASTLALSRASDGVYEGQGANLSLAGLWMVTVVIQQAANSTSVPLEVDARTQPQTVRTIEAPGQPTLYSIDLPAGRLLNVFLDPERPGVNEVHATFIDAGGGELPVPRPALILVGSPGGSLHTIPVRRFGPGHFIGDAQLAAGAWQVEITAVARDGATFDARFTILLR
jgi:copper transport protein